MSGAAVSNLNEVRSPSNELQHHCIRAVGSASAITKVTGPGVSVARLDTGDYQLTWSQDPGNLLGVGAYLSATTPGNLAGHTVIPGAFVPATGSTNATLLVNVFDAADASHDLAALEWVTVIAEFSFTNLDL